MFCGIIKSHLTELCIIFVFITLDRTTEKTIADSLPIENLSENPGPREIIKVGYLHVHVV